MESRDGVARSETGSLWLTQFDHAVTSLDMAKFKDDETPVETPLPKASSVVGVEVFAFTCTKCNTPQRAQKMFPGTLCASCFSP